MNVIRKLYPYFKPHMTMMVLALLCAGLVGVTAGATGYLIKPVIDEIFIQKDMAKLSMLPWVIALVYLVRGTARFFSSYLLRYVGEAVILALRCDLMDYIQGRELGFFDANPTGTLVARISSDVPTLRRAIPDVIQLIRQVVTVLGLMWVVFFLNWKLALFAFLVFPLAAYPVGRISKLLKRYSKKNQAQMGDITAILTEVFSGIEVVKIFRRESTMLKKFRDESDKLLKVRLKMAKLDVGTGPLLEFLGGAAGAGVIWYGGTLVFDGVMTTGEFFAFTGSMFMLFDPIRRAGRLNNSLHTAIGAGERVFDLMEEPVSHEESTGEVGIAGELSEVRFEEVRFAYGPEEPEVLKGMSFAAKRGDVVALVGDSGAGKSTALKLLPRLYAPTSGRITINGVDVMELSPRVVRDNIAVVSQNTFLFDDSIANNILVGKPTADEGEVERVAMAANAHDFITDFPEGYETPVGERGDLLSGGQKQRVAIARALLKDAPILILDEATSALDSGSESEVQEALGKLMKGRTTFVIAHRLSTVREADRILYLKDGVVAEAGTHEELIALGGGYARLSKLQFGEG